MQDENASESVCFSSTNADLGLQGEKKTAAEIREDTLILNHGQQRKWIACKFETKLTLSY